jgi:hypothetical protein
MSLIIFKFYSKYLAKVAFEGPGKFKIERKVIHTEICRYLVMLSNEETVLQGMTERPTENGRFCGIEMNVGRKWESQGNHLEYRLW